MKSFQDKLNDIYEHTDQKTSELIREAVKLYNKEKLIGRNPAELPSI